MITRAKFQNFKALRDVEVTFDSRLTVIVGPNGSGKTSVLRVISLLGQVAAGYSAENVLMGEFAPSLTHSGDPAKPQILEATSSIGDGPAVTIRIVVTNAGGSQKIITDVTVPSNGNTQGVKSPQAAPDNALRKLTFLQLDARKIATPSIINQLPPVTAPDGQGAASTLAYLDRLQRPRFRQAVEALKRVIPNVTDLRIDYDTTGGGVRDSLLFDFQGAPGVRAGSASTGTLLVAGLLSVIFGPASPHVILLDDLDYALHPKGQMELVELLHDLLDAFPELQIIATAHSPYILDRLRPNEVRVMALNDDGSAVCKPLTDHPDFERWKDAMSPGEFWSTFYEDWLTKSRTPQTVP